MRRIDVRGVGAPLASATKTGVSLREDLDFSVWNPDSNVSNYKLVEPDDFVIGLRSFQHGISHSEVRGIVSPAYHVLRCLDGLEPRYYKYYFRSQLLISKLANITQGIRQGQSIDMDAFADVRLPVPPLREQQRIADFLDAETARIEALGVARSRHLELLRELSVARVTSAFKLGSDVPGVRLGYLATIQTGVTVDASRASGSDDVTRPYLRVANVQAGYVDLNEVAEIVVPRRLAAGSSLQTGDVLMTEGGDLDKLGRGTVWEGQIDGCLHQNHVFAVRVNKRLLDAHYLALLTRTVPARVHFESTGSKTTNLASTSSSKIRDLRVPLPPVRRQQAVVAEVDEALAAIGEVVSAVQRQRHLLAERKQALITAAVTGQFDVTTGRGADLS